MARAIVGVVAAAALLGALALTVWLVWFVHGQRIPFDTDEADHALPALDLSLALRHGDAGGFGRAIAAQAFYPPVHSTLCAASLLLFGPTHFAARLPSVLFFFVTAVVVAWAAYRHVKAWGGDAAWLALGSAAIAVVLAVTCPEAIDNAVLCMLEPLGTLWCALLLSRAVSEESGESARGVLVLAALTIVIALTKYSFGLPTIAAVGCAILLQPRPGDRSTAIRRGLWFSVWVAAGLAVWLLITDAHSAWRFITGHESYSPMLGRANLLFDVKAWVRGYFVSPLVSLAVLPLIATAAVSGWRRFSIRLAGLFLVFTEVMELLSTTNETRHSLFVLPAAWYLSAVGAARLIERMAPRVGARGSRGIAGPVALASFVVVVVGFWFGARLPGLEYELRRALEGKPELAELQRDIVAHLDPVSPILGNGFTDQFSLQGLRFVLAGAASVPSTALQLDAYPYSQENLQRELDRKRHVDRPFLEPTFPRAPLSAVLERGYYRYAVQLQRISGASRGGETEVFRRTLDRFPETSYQAGEWRVAIWDLRERTPGATANPP
jgi:hypothetical protein